MPGGGSLPLLLPSRKETRERGRTAPARPNPSKAKQRERERERKQASPARGWGTELRKRHGPVQSSQANKVSSSKMCVFTCEGVCGIPALRGCSQLQGDVLDQRASTAATGNMPVNLDQGAPWNMPANPAAGRCSGPGLHLGRSSCRVMSWTREPHRCNLQLMRHTQCLLRIRVQNESRTCGGARCLTQCSWSSLEVHGTVALVPPGGDRGVLLESSTTLRAAPGFLSLSSASPPSKDKQ